jgi:CO/xanthine dehydrogenase Mo-binding subunit
LTGDGIALTMIDTVPPAGHFADCNISLRADGGFDLTVGTAEFGNGTSTVHRQIAASALATTVDRIRLLQSDTAHGGHDTGAYGSAGTFVAGRATQAAAEALAGQLKQFAASLLGENPDACTLDNHATVCAGRRTPYALLAASAQSLGEFLSANGNSSGTPRSVAFNVQGFRVAVNKAASPNRWGRRSMRKWWSTTTAGSSIPGSATTICHPLPTSPVPKCSSPTRGIRLDRWAPSR